MVTDLVTAAEIPDDSYEAHEFYDDGLLAFCRLSRDIELVSARVPVESGIHFDTSGHVDWIMLHRDTDFDGIVARGDGQGFMTEFHRNGRLKRAYLARNTVIDGITCRRFAFWRAVFGAIHGKSGGTDFHDDGTLALCELAETLDVEGKTYLRGTVLRFDERGRLVR